MWPCRRLGESLPRLPLPEHIAELPRLQNCRKKRAAPAAPQSSPLKKKAKSKGKGKGKNSIYTDETDSEEDEDQFVPSDEEEDEDQLLEEEPEQGDEELSKPESKVSAFARPS